MKNTESLKKNNDFRIVYRNGKSVSNRLLVLYKLPNNTNRNRLGISVSKKVGNSVVRSRITRLIRESYRKHEDKVSIGWDLVIIARNPANGATFHEISGSMYDVFKKHKIYEDK
ncbi:MAG: ribonuclease P protein component [Epulopiscium sp.]|nr:ribonuclease P protein component [Candidatus Epulonipiscium sp.]